MSVMEDFFVYGGYRSRSRGGAPAKVLRFLLNLGQGRDAIAQRIKLGIDVLEVVFHLGECLILGGHAAIG
jgi:hypothetical protein